LFIPLISNNILLDLKEVFNILRKHKLKLNIEKCRFYRYEVEALGHKVTNKGLLPIKKKVEAISKMNIPNNITELRSFLGMVGYYRNFIDNYALISAPLCKLLRKNMEYIWTLEHTESFNKLINALVNAPILCYPRFDKPFIIRSDASFNGIGSVLLQLYDDNIEHPVYFVSRSLTKSERNYAITELEGTAAYYCINQFRPYILSNPFQTILYTDHLPLVSIIKKLEPATSKHVRWCNLFSQFQVNIVYQPGKGNIIADALSRIRKNDNIIVDTLINNNTNEENNDGGNNSIENNSNNDENNLIEAINDVENEKYIDEFMKKFLKDRIITIDGKTYIRDNNKLRLVIDDYLEKVKIIGMAHRTGHDGVQKTYDRIKQNYYWKNMIIDIKKYVSLCKI